MMKNEIVFFNETSKDYYEEIFFTGTTYYAKIYSCGAETVRKFKSLSGAKKWLNV